MMKRFSTLLLSAFIGIVSYAQNNTFIFLTSGHNLYSTSINKAGNACSVPTAITSCAGTKPLSIALFNNTLYYNDNKGVLYSSTYDSSTNSLTNCTSLGSFSFTNLAGIYGLTVDSKGIVYGASGAEIQTYNPTTSAFSVVHNLPNNNWSIGGDLIFWGGHLFEACTDKANATQIMVEVDTSNYANSSIYLTFDPANKIFGISSVKVPCSFNQVYALTQTGDIYPVDMYAKKEILTKTCSISGLGNINDAASTAEAGLDQKPTPPANPITPNDICVGQPFTFSVGINDPAHDVLHWFTPPNTPPSNSNFSLNTPAVNVNAVGSTKYLITEFNNTTLCESDTVSIVVNIHPYPTKPVVVESADTICNNSNSTLSITAPSQTVGATYHWSNAQGSTGSTGISYSATATNSYAVTATTFALPDNPKGCSTTSDSVKLRVLNSSINYLGNPFCNNGFGTVSQFGDIVGGLYSASSTDLVIDSKTGTIDLANSKKGTYTITYTLNYTSNNSPSICQYTTGVTINVPDSSTTNASICGGSIYSFNGKTYSAAGTYNAKLTNSKGCDSIAILNLTIKSPTSSSTAITVCPSALPYTWNKQTYNAAGTYTVHLTNIVGCDSVTTLVLSVSNTVTSSTPVTICPSALPYTWNKQTYNAAGTYTVHLTSSTGCDSVATLVLSLATPTTSSTNVSVCPAGLPYTWNSQTYNTAGTYVVHLTNSAGCDSAATLVLTVNNTLTSTTPITICPSALPYTWNKQVYNTAGTYTVHLTNSSGCDSVATLVLTVQPKSTVAPISGATSVAINQSIILTDPTSGGVWSVVPTSIASIDNAGSLTGTAPGAATVAYTLENTPCGSDTAFYVVTVNSEEVFIPNLFSPDGNGHNDLFYVRGIDAAYKNVRLIVYDSWGGKLFESDGHLNDPSTGWDGQYKGKPQPAGAYVYIAKFTLLSGQVTTKKGIINLIR